MKLAISNIAWLTEEEKAIASLLVEKKITRVEIAPTKIWSQPLQAATHEVDEYRNFWQGYGIDIVALQSLVFGRPDLTLFDSKEKRVETLAYLKGIIELGANLGAKVVVFGSPKNRLRGALPDSEALAIAQDFFFKLGEVAKKRRVAFCIEPNPAVYGCDFLTTTKEGLELVQRAGSEGFKLHLDAAGITLAQEPIGETIAAALPLLRHFHISEPGLGLVGGHASKINHQECAKALNNNNYRYIASIEMRTNPEGGNVHYVEQAIDFAKKTYGDS